jgi:hypothetical protein
VLDLKKLSTRNMGDKPDDLDEVHCGRAATQTLAENRTEICIDLAFHSHPPTPLLPALTLSAGEFKVSVGEVPSSDVGLASLHSLLIAMDHASVSGRGPGQATLWTVCLDAIDCGERRNVVNRYCCRSQSTHSFIWMPRRLTGGMVVIPRVDRWRHLSGEYKIKLRQERR